MEWLPTTLSKSRSEKSIDVDFALHNRGVVLQVLRDVAPDFVESIRGNPDLFNERAFPGAHLHAAYNYYRYVLKAMKPKPSDTPDLHQVSYVHYSSMSILEKSMAGTLRQSKSERGLLSNAVQSIRHLRAIVD